MLKTLFLKNLSQKLMGLVTVTLISTTMFLSSTIGVKGGEPLRNPFFPTRYNQFSKPKTMLQAEPPLPFHKNVNPRKPPDDLSTNPSTPAQTFESSLGAGGTQPGPLNSLNQLIQLELLNHNHSKVFQANQMITGGIALNTLQTNKTINTIECQLTQTRGELTQTRGKLTQTQEQLTQTRGKLTQTRGKLTQTQEQLTQTRGKLTQTRGKLTQTQEQLTQTQGRLKETQGKLKETQQQINILQSNTEGIVNFHYANAFNYWEKIQNIISIINDQPDDSRNLFNKIMDFIPLALRFERQFPLLDADNATRYCDLATFYYSIIFQIHDYIVSQPEEAQKELSPIWDLIPPELLFQFTFREVQNAKNTFSVLQQDVQDLKIALDPKSKKIGRKAEEKEAFKVPLPKRPKNKEGEDEIFFITPDEFNSSKKNQLKKWKKRIQPELTGQFP